MSTRFTAKVPKLTAAELRRMYQWAQKAGLTRLPPTPILQEPPMDIMPYNRVIGTLLANPDARQAVLYLSPKRTVRATRRRYLVGRKTGLRKPSKRAAEIVLTDGPPNYREQARIKKLQKEKQGQHRGFPVEEIEVR